MLVSWEEILKSSRLQGSRAGESDLMPDTKIPRLLLKGPVLVGLFPLVEVSMCSGLHSLESPCKREHHGEKWGFGLRCLGVGVLQCLEGPESWEPDLWHLCIQSPESPNPACGKGGSGHRWQSLWPSSERPSEMGWPFHI